MKLQTGDQHTNNTNKEEHIKAIKDKIVKQATMTDGDFDSEILPLKEKKESLEREKDDLEKEISKLEDEIDNVLYDKKHRFKLENIDDDISSIRDRLDAVEKKR